MNRLRKCFSWGGANENFLWSRYGNRGRIKDDLKVCGGAISKDPYFLFGLLSICQFIYLILTTDTLALYFPVSSTLHSFPSL